MGGGWFLTITVQICQKKKESTSFLAIWEKAKIGWNTCKMGHIISRLHFFLKVDTKKHPKNLSLIPCLKKYTYSWSGPLRIAEILIIFGLSSPRKFARIGHQITWNYEIVYNSLTFPTQILSCVLKNLNINKILY